MYKKQKPDFLVVGAAKSGTTSLFHYLNQHPDIYIPEVKECRFFSQMSHNQKGLGGEKFQNTGIRYINEYFSLFKGYEDKIIGDISNDYLYHYKSSIKNIKKYCKDDIKIIIILRNPIDRAYSNYLHHIRDGWEECSFEEALIKEFYRIKNKWSWPYHYVNTGMYFEQVKAYRENFKNVKIFLYEEFNDKVTFYDDLFKFLCVDNIVINDEKIYNKSGYPQSKLLSNFVNKKHFSKDVGKFFIPVQLRIKIINFLKNKNLKNIPINKETREYLKNIFSDDIRKLEKLIDKDLSKWLK